MIDAEDAGAVVGTGEEDPRPEKEQAGEADLA
jgi:hypothetical protein